MFKIIIRITVTIIKINNYTDKMMIKMSNDKQIMLLIMMIVMEIIMTKWLLLQLHDDDGEVN